MNKEGTDEKEWNHTDEEKYGTFFIFGHHFLRISLSLFEHFFF